MSTLSISQEIQDLWDKQVYQLDDYEIQIIQADRSDYRKNRFQKLPILISILNEINNSSNLADLANRYDKYKLKKKSELQIQKEFNEIMNSVNFSQNKNKINLYQKSQISDKKVQIQVSEQELPEKKTNIEDIIEMLEKTQSNIQADMNKIKEENKNLENKINSYFDSLQTEDSNSCRQLNVLNYNLSQRQSYYQDIQISTLPILVSEKQEWQIKVQIQENKISQLEQDLQNLSPLEQIYKHQENYISQLKYAQQLLKNEVTNFKDKIEQLKQAQQIMLLELKFESFCQQLLEFQQKGKTQALLDFQELLKNEKLRMVQKYKKDCNKSFVSQQEMFDFDYDEMEEIADELSQNKSQVEKNRKIQILKKQTQDKMSKIKLEQQRLKNENNQLTDELSNEKTQQLSLKLQQLQQQKDSYYETYQLKESDIQKLEEEIKIAKLMSEDIEKNNSKQSITEENESSSTKGWFRRLLSH